MEIEKPERQNVEGESRKRVKANRGAPGMDKTGFIACEKDLKNNLYKIDRMSSGSYMPIAVKGVEIPKKDGKKRLLSVPIVYSYCTPPSLVLEL
ncbi:reverse transcriptase [Paenibacillus hemerocallicola]|uniref:Reverse transcriptase n=1 Tax=Paenibacillus hemerocallicola TaxID=1172614 RepID=A0A5C4SZ53_9BACL|nr:reverse transcriptase [Paenibacillus hemerocallicola]TNJ62042.1 reverse transcriptase [Paenibacillus hemerocallicola]